MAVVDLAIKNLPNFEQSLESDKNQKSMVAKQNVKNIKATFENVLGKPYSYLIKELIPLPSFIKRPLLKSRIDPEVEKLILSLFVIQGKAGLEDAYNMFFEQQDSNDKRTDEVRLKQFALYLKTQGEALLEYLPKPIPVVKANQADSLANSQKKNSTLQSNEMNKQDLRKMGHTPETWKVLVEDYKKAMNKFCEKNQIALSIKKTDQDGDIVYETQAKNNVNQIKKIKRKVKSRVTFTSDFFLTFFMAAGQMVMNVAAILLLFTNPMVGIPVTLGMGLATLVTNFVLVQSANVKNFMKFIGMPITLLIAWYKGADPGELKALRNEIFHGFAADLTKHLDNPWKKTLAIVGAAFFAVLGVTAAVVFGVGAFWATLSLPATFPFITTGMAIGLGIWLGLTTAISLGGLMYCGLVDTTKKFMKFKFRDAWSEFKREWQQANDNRTRKIEMVLSVVLTPLLMMGVLTLAILGTIATLGALYGPMVSFLTTYLAASPAVATGIAAVAVFGITSMSSFVFNSNAVYTVLGLVADAVTKAIAYVTAGIVGLVKPNKVSADDTHPLINGVAAVQGQPVSVSIKTNWSDLGIKLAIGLKTAAIWSFYGVMAGLVLINAFATGIFSGGGARTIQEFFAKMKMTLTSGQALIAAVVPGTIISAGANGAPVYGKFQESPNYHNNKLHKEERVSFIDSTPRRINQIPEGRPIVRPQGVNGIPGGQEGHQRVKRTRSSDGTFNYSHPDPSQADPSHAAPSHSDPSYDNHFSIRRRRSLSAGAPRPEQQFRPGSGNV